MYHQYINKELVFVSNESFHQNKEIVKDLSSYVFNLINYNSVTCIAGESHLYCLVNPIVKYIYHYSNSIHMKHDLDFNNKFYRKQITNQVIDFNTFTNIKNAHILILAKLNINLLDTVNKRFYKKIIIIDCHADVFWKRIKYLSNYKLVSRVKFITSLNFITVNVFEYKYEIPEFVSLGFSCATAYTLNDIGLRVHGYPFDWCKFNFKKLIHALRKQFSIYNRLEIKKFSENHLTLDNTSGSYILTNVYGISFAHEVIEKDSVSEFEKKLKDRFFRFIKLCNKYVIFVIFDDSTKSIDTDLLIKSLNGYIDTYKILYIGKVCPPLNDHIKFIDISKVEFIDWKYSNINWYDIIFNSL
jgi:hypothetical protein